MSGQGGPIVFERITPCPLQLGRTARRPIEFSGKGDINHQLSYVGYRSTRCLQLAGGRGKQVSCMSCKVKVIT